MKNLKEYIAQVKSGSIDIVEQTHKALEASQKINDLYNYFTVISSERALAKAHELKKQIAHKKAKGKLAGVFISVKDSICVSGVESTAGSRILSGYKPLFDAHVITRIQQEGAIVIGKTSQDEFGFGSFSVNIGKGYAIPKNPFDMERSCGGSSGGAAGITQKATFPHIAIGESTGGSIAEPASFCGVFGLCPTYGRVSRHGLIDFGNSLDKIGAMGKQSYDTALLQSVLSGYDSKDSTSLKAEDEDYTKAIGMPVKTMKVGIIKEAFGNNDAAVEKQVHAAVERLKEAGAHVQEVSLKFPIDYGLAVYYIIAPSEASTNLAKYCGMRYGKAEHLAGNFNEYFTKVRSEHLGDEAKRRIIMGTFARMSGYRDAYYIKAAKVRTLMIQEYKRAFKTFDALVSPSVPILAPKFSEISKLTPLQHYLMDVALVGPNVAGLPHLNVPVGFEGKLPVGMLLIGDHLDEAKLLQLGSVFEK